MINSNGTSLQAVGASEVIPTMAIILPFKHSKVKDYFHLWVITVIVAMSDEL